MSYFCLEIQVNFTCLFNCVIIMYEVDGEKKNNVIQKEKRNSNKLSSNQYEEIHIFSLDCKT